VAQHLDRVALVQLDVVLLVHLDAIQPFAEFLTLKQLNELVLVEGLTILFEDGLLNQEVQPVGLDQLDHSGVQRVEVDLQRDLLQLVAHEGVGQEGLGLHEVEDHLGVQVVAGADGQEVSKVRKLQVALLLVGLELHGVEDGVGGELLEDQLGVFLHSAPGDDAAVLVAGEGGDREALVVDLVLGVVVALIQDNDFV